MSVRMEAPISMSRGRFEIFVGLVVIVMKSLWTLCLHYGYIMITDIFISILS